MSLAGSAGQYTVYTTMRLPIAVLCAGAFTASGAQTSPEPVRLAGSWLVTITAPNRGELVARMGVEQQDTSWAAFSRSGGVRPFVSTPKYLFGRLLGKVPGKGALAFIDSGHVLGDRSVRGKLRSQMIGDYLVVATIAGGRITGTLRRNPAGPDLGRITAVRDTVAAAIRDYPAVAAGIERAITDNIYQPRLAASPQFRRFFAELREDFAKARDDLDVLASFHARVRSVGLSHLNLTRDPVLATMPLDSLVTRVQGPPDSLVRFSFLADGVGYLFVRKWDQVSGAVHRAFARLDSGRAHTLILDVRENRGGDNSALSPLAHLYKEGDPVGVLLGRKWYVSHDAPPSAEELRAIPVLTKDTGVEVLRFIRDSGAVVGKIAPQAPYFGGRLYVLTSGASGSASEPLVHHLRATKRATTIGARTAGAMLTQLPHDVGQGWVMLLPEADYYTADGTRLEGNGVSPDIPVAPSDAVVAAGGEIAKADPLAGALVRALGLVALRRWDAAFAEVDRALAIAPNSPAALYVLGRVAAASGQRLDEGTAALRRYLERPATVVGSPAGARSQLAAIDRARSRKP